MTNSQKLMICIALVIGVTAIALVVGGLNEDEQETRRDDPRAETGSGGRSVSRPSSASAGTGTRGSHPTKRSGGAGDDRSRSGAQGSAGSEPADEDDPKKTVAQMILEKKGLPLFDENDGLSKEIAEALGLSDEEFEVLDQTLRNALDDLGDLRAENIEVRQRSDSQLFLKIRSFPEQGAELRSSLDTSLREQLGDERYASFMLMSGDSLESEYLRFGRAYQTISFNVYDSQSTGDRRIRITDRLHYPDGNGDWAVVENGDNYDHLPDTYAPFFELANSGATNPIPESTLPQPPEQTDQAPGPE